MNLDETIKQAIKQSGLSAKKLAKASGVSQPQISRYLRGERSLSTDTLGALLPHLPIEVRLKPQQPTR